MSTYGFDRQLAIYGSGQPPALPLAFEQWEARARTVLSDAAFGYIAGGAGGGETMEANQAAFKRRHLRPRLLHDVGDRDLTVTVLGTPSALPVFLAPVGVLGIAHPEADGAAARAAAALGIPFILSTVSSHPMEQVAVTMGNAPHWFQLYPGRDPEINRSLLRRAEAAGYRAVVVTADTPMLGWREWDLRNAYLPFLQGLGLANFFTDPAFRGRLARPPEDDPATAIREFLSVFVNPAFDWQSLAALRRDTRLPLLLKGITHADDARLALECGVDGLVVSNHGGRQVDGAVAALDALPAVADVAAGRVPVLFDSGIRRGADVLKALALGASAVLLGRPYAYGLAVAGEEGVSAVIQNLAADLDLELALCGLRTIRDVDREFVIEGDRR